MFAYFIEEWVYEKKHRKQADRFDLGTTQHGITGRKIKLGRLSDLSADIRDCVTAGTKTFVAVGDDATASRLLNHLMKLKNSEPEQFEQAHILFGYVPVVDKSIIAEGFGVTSMNDALQALQAHTSKKIDVGMLNNRHWFFSTAQFPQRSALTFLTYSVTSLHEDHAICVCNSKAGFNTKQASAQHFNMSDGVLEAVIAYHPKKGVAGRLMQSYSGNEACEVESVFPVKKIKISHKEKTISVYADTEKQLSTPIEVVVVPKALDVIVGTA